MAKANNNLNATDNDSSLIAFKKYAWFMECCAHGGRDKKCIQNFEQKTRWEDCFEDLGLDGVLVLKLILQKPDRMV
jgi:hypothetical protein